MPPSTSNTRGGTNGRTLLVLTNAIWMLVVIVQFMLPADQILPPSTASGPIAKEPVVVVKEVPVPVPIPVPGRCDKQSSVYEAKAVTTQKSDPHAKNLEGREEGSSIIVEDAASVSKGELAVSPPPPPQGSNSPRRARKSNAAPPAALTLPPRMNLPPVPASTSGMQPASCPAAASSVWLPLWFKSVQTPTPPSGAGKTALPHFNQRPVLLVDVGANKGHTIGEWMSLFAPSEKAGRQLSIDLVKYATLNGIERFCGLCCTCGPSKAAAIARKNTQVTEKRHVQIVGFEPLRATHQGLTDFFGRKRNTIANIEIDFVHRAIVDELGVSSTSADYRGSENVTLAEPIGKRRAANRARKVYTTTLDHYFATSYHLKDPSAVKAGKGDGLEEDIGIVVKGAEGAGGDDVVDGPAETTAATTKAQPLQGQEEGTEEGAPATTSGSHYSHVYIDLLAMNTEENDVDALRGSRTLLSENRVGTLLFTLPRARENVEPQTHFSTELKKKIFEKLRNTYGFKCFIFVEKADPSFPLVEMDAILKELDESSSALLRKYFTLDQRLSLLCVSEVRNPTLVESLSKMASAATTGSLDAASMLSMPHRLENTKDGPMCKIEDYVNAHHMRHTQAPLKAGTATAPGAQPAKPKSLTEWQRRKIRSVAIQDFFDFNGDVEALLRDPIYTAAPPSPPQSL